MLGDEAQPAAGDPARRRASSGPRHAAPRKSLLTKLHVPAGKAVALAAMPTAVLMGMGITPHLAQADEPGSPFAPGPCVTRSDSPAPSASPSASVGGTAEDKGGDDAKGAGASGTSKGGAGEAAKGARERGKSTGTGGSAAGGGGSTGTPSPSATSGPATSPTPSTSPSPSPSRSPRKQVDPLDPLGLGDLLGGLLGVNGKAAGGSSAPATSAPAPTAPKAGTASAVKSFATPSAPKSAAAGSGSGSGGTGSGSGTVERTAKGAEKAVKDLADPSPTGTPSPSASASPGASKGADGSKGGQQAYPCPEYDAKALADADVEQGIPLLPDQPWTLKSSILTLHGLSYEGVVKVRTAGGAVKDVLKFTASGVDIGDLDQLVAGPDNTRTEVRAAAHSTSTIRNGTVTMYTESLSGNLLGVVPVTFTPKAPPPLTLPELFFTDVTVVQAAQFGGDLHVPGMRVLPGQT
ncbi:hypothetical protein [Actinacidiphila yeochonensis]|uniref:hypothetical protein n=1 Tax=Actinacidiphila yeochonensis TaxID=89050 RepID=UPI00056CD0D3|nr:hypothetical protein [Actinacidiphila yeochonensis]